MLRAAIFDLDGLLIDSEPLWQLAEVEVFARAGLHITTQECTQTMGYRIDEAVAYWAKKQPWVGYTNAQVVAMVVERLKELMTERGKPLPGVMHTLDFFESRNIPMAVASSSNLDIIEHALAILGIRQRFQVVCSAQFEDYGKPHPQVFIKAAQLLNVSPDECVVFEDSFFGLIAAKAAKMKAVAVPEHQHLQNPKFAFADVILPSLESWNETIWLNLGGQ